MAGASWVSISDQSPTRSGLQADNAVGSFNYTAPVINLPSVARSAAFWQARTDPRSMLMPNGMPEGTPEAGAAGVPWWVLAAGALALAGGAWWWFRGR